jgi:histidinol-phosphate aminotransferase
VPFTRSQTNFILLGAESGTPDEGSLHEELLRRGVIARDGAALGVPGTIRLTIGAPQENDAFLAALSQVSTHSMSKS